MIDLAVCLERIGSAKCLQRLGAKSYLPSLHWGITLAISVRPSKGWCAGTVHEKIWFCDRERRSSFSWFSKNAGDVPMFFAGDDA